MALNKETGDFVETEFHRTFAPKQDEGSVKSSEKGSEKMPPVLALIAQDPKDGAKALADQLGSTSRAVETQIAQL